MTVDTIRNAVIRDGNEVHFKYNNRKCGIEPSIENGIFTFEAWYGEKWKEYSDFDEMISDKLFDGKSFLDILSNIELFFA